MEEKICCLCGKIFTEWGNNAQPLKDGRCCDKCNYGKVVPERIKRYENAKNKKSI